MERCTYFDHGKYRLMFDGVEYSNKFVDRLAHYEDLEEQGRVVKCAEWETVIETKNDTVCGDSVRVSYKRCSNCEQPMGLSGDRHCGNCGALMFEAALTPTTASDVPEGERV